jgi:hypothetical protein
LRTYVLPVKLLADMPVIPEKTFVAFNLSYEPAFVRIGGTWQQENPIEISLSASTAILGNAYLGAEIRQLILNQHGFFSGRALYVGPSLFVRLSDAITVKVAGRRRFQLRQPAAMISRISNATKSARNLRGIFELRSMRASPRHTPPGVVLEISDFALRRACRDA